MKLYEGMFILHNREITDETDAPDDTVRGLLEKVGASVERSVVWANRKLAYPIKGNQTGTYVLTYFRGEPDAVAQIHREVGLNERCLRVICFNVDEIPTDEQLTELVEAAGRATRRDLADTGRNYFKEFIDYKNVALLRRVITNQGKLFSRKRSGASASHQRQLKRAVHRARIAALLPFVSR